MKITFVSVSSEGIHVNQLKEAAQKRNVEFEVINFTSLQDFESKLPQIGQVVIWRSSDLDVGVSRTVAMNMLSGKYLINLGVAKQPFVTNKLYQQKTISKLLDYAAIPTFVFKDKEALEASLNSGELKLPFIQKPNLGARGVDVRLIKSLEDLKENVKPVKAYVYQNFIPNTGDYRAFILGGRMLGVMKRVAQEGSILNNVSQGASAYVETDVKVIKEVRDIAIKVASIFNLQLCGVDIIFDTKTQKYHFLEVNTVPQWKGFYEATGIDVAGEIIDYCIQMGETKTSPREKVMNFFTKSYPYLYAQKFHFASRLHLWSGKKEFGDLVAEFRKNESLYDLENGIIEERIKRSLFEDAVYKTDKVSKKRQYRRDLKNKYPKIKKFSEVMSVYFFAKTLYNLDIAELVQKYISSQELKDLVNAVSLDEEAIANASTTCINFLYFSKFYLNSIGENLVLDPLKFLHIAKNHLSSSDKDSIDTRVYLLTHTLLGESEFYSKQMDLTSFAKEILEYLEKTIHENFFLCTLDMKLEFLVCAKLFKYQTFLEKIIINQAENSFGILGNYIIDQDNKKDARTGENVYSAEHRNVLYLMATSARG